MDYPPLANALVPYIGDFLSTLLPVVFFYLAIKQAIKVSTPFRWYALLWYVVVVAGALMVIYVDISALQPPLTVHTAIKAIGYVAGAGGWLWPHRRLVSATDWSAIDHNYYRALREVS